MAAMRTTSTTVRRPITPIRQGVSYGLGPAGILTGGADIVWVVGTASVTTLWNRAQKPSGNDTIWAIAETFIGGLVAMSVASVAEAPTLRNVSMGISVGGAVYLINKLIPEARSR